MDMCKKDVIDKITDLQKLTIAKGLCDYRYIMEHWKDNDEDFQKVYYDFYLKARTVIRTSKYREAYFNIFSQLSSDAEMDEILEKTKKITGDWEFSIASKLLHTINDELPIYDSKIREYLSSKENVPFWWQRRMKDSKRPRGASVEKQIQHDWEELKAWYEKFLQSERGKKWIKWFDKNFPDFEDISNVKKVDFIIFATN